jgi:hypothetical protein
MDNVTQGFIVNKLTDTNWLTKQDFRRYRNFRQDDFFLFLTDSAAARKNLTLNLGLRWKICIWQFTSSGMGTVAKVARPGS